MSNSLFAPISNFWYALLNLLYPQNCLICNYKLKALRPTPICETCWDKIHINSTAPSVEGDGEGFASVPPFHQRGLGFDSAFYVATYDDIIKRCIHLFKYEGKVWLANPLGKLMADFASKNINVGEIDLIVPVPLHPKKLRERQFNQSELLAIHLAKRFNKKLVRNCVQRVRYTIPQTALRRDERLKNVRGAFLAKQVNGFEDSTILLVDDVFTTGATLNECASALKDAGAKNVIAFALARGN